MRERLVVLVTTVLAMLMSACASQPVVVSEAPSPTTEPTSTAEPTSTPKPTATLSPTPGPGLEELLLTPIALAANADLTGARAAYDDIATLYPGRADALLGLAALAQRQNDPAAALKYLQAAADADPHSKEALRQWAVLLEQQGQYDALVGVYSRMVALAPEDANALVARAEAYARIGNAELSAADLELAQQIDPYREYAWLNVAGAAYGARQYEVARTIATKGLGYYKNSTGLLMTRALSAMCLDDPSDAIEDLDLVIKLDALDPDAYHWKGRVLLDQGEYSRAAELLTKAGELGVQSGVSGVNQAYESMSYAADATSRSDVNAAFAYLASEVVQFGSRDGLMMGYGLVRWRQGNIPLALGRMDDLVQSGFIPALYWRGVIKAATDDKAGAIVDLEAFLKVRASGPDAEKARALIKELGN